MRAGRLSVVIQKAEGLTVDRRSNADFFCAAEVPNYGKLFTEDKFGGEDLIWDEELTFALGPTNQSTTMNVMLYEVQPENSSDDKKLVGMGCMSLEGIEQEVKHEVSLPLVSGTGKHIATVDLSCRFFPSRSPGMGRDELGRQTLDPIMICRGPTDAPKELNERSPKKWPRRGRSEGRHVAGSATA